MTDLSQRIDAHLIQCHRDDDDSERLLVETKAEIARLDHEMEATKEAARAREAMLRDMLQEALERISDAKKITGLGFPSLHHRAERLIAALNGEGGE